MSKKFLDEKGITLTILVLTVIVMLILVTTVGISVSGYADVKTLKTFYNDIKLVREKTDIYYEKNNTLPVSEEITSNVTALLGDSRNANDGEKYYKLDVSLLDNIILTYGVNRTPNDYYIINEDSHNIYYYPGIIVNGVTYYGIKDVSTNTNIVNFDVENFELKTEVIAEVTDGVPNIKLRVYSDIINGSISQYKFKIDNEEWTAAQSQNSYTFDNLKQYETYTVSMMIIDNKENEIYATNNETKVTIKNLPISLTIDGKVKGTYNNPVVPAGFYAINENNAIWGSSDGYKNGLVITDEIDENGNSIGNEFVWVPVDGETVKFERFDFEKGTALASCKENVPTELAESVNNNGGFYIARYEAGQAVNGKPISRKGVTVYNKVNWNNAKSSAEAMYPSTDENYGVISTLIYGTQWDTALRFIGAYNVGETGYDTYATNSIGMGNYATGDNFTSTTAPTTTGAENVFRQKNIYDMAGNVWEWTMEEYNTSRIYRGASFNNNGTTNPASYRYNNTSGINYNGSDVGFRVALYIKEL